MNLSNLSQRTLAIVALGPTIAFAAAMMISIPWLKSLPDTLALSITTPATLAVVGWGLFISTLASRRQDEVQRASGRFAVSYGFIGGMVLVVLLLLIPPFQDGVTNAANGLATALKGDADKAPMLAFVGGVMTLMLAQSLCTIVTGVWWWKSKR